MSIENITLSMLMFVTLSFIYTQANMPQ